jgi:antitoxin FitA
MANITVKNIPDDLYKNLQYFAAINHRSLNNEIIVCMEKSMRGRRFKTAQFLDKAQEIREEIKLPYLTDDKLNSIKQEGRL